MTPENLINPLADHLEVASNPNAVRRPSQVTLRTLLECMGVQINLTSESINYSSQIFSKGTLGTSQPEAIGHIHQCETSGQTDTTLNTDYFILDTPDGLLIEKRGRLFESIILAHGGFTSAKERNEKFGRIMNSFAAQKEAHHLEDELGLNFVSEDEAQNLINILSRKTDGPGASV